MAYWNPFGWDEETRRGIQSIVRPVVQVASFAGSMGAFSGGEAAANTGTPAAGATPETPFTPSPTDPNIDALDPAIGQQDAWLEQQGPSLQESQAPGFGKDAPVPVDPQYFPQSSPTMIVPAESGFTQSPESLTGNQYTNTQSPVDFSQPMPEGFNPTDGTSPGMGIDPNATTSQAINRDWMSAAEGALPSNQNLNATADSNTVQLEVQPFPQTAESAKPPKVEPPTTETPNKPEAKTKTADTQEIENTTPKPEGGDEKGPGGKKKSIWEGGLNWENIQKFLASDEGKKWMLSDEGLFGIGSRIIAAADAGTSAYNALSPEERKKIWDKLTKERKERKKKRLRRGE